MGWIAPAEGVGRSWRSKPSGEGNVSWQRVACQSNALNAASDGAAKVRSDLRVRLSESRPGTDSRSKRWNDQVIGSYGTGVWRTMGSGKRMQAPAECFQHFVVFVAASTITARVAGLVAAVRPCHQTRRNSALLDQLRRGQMKCWCFDGQCALLIHHQCVDVLDELGCSVEVRRIGSDRTDDQTPTGMLQRTRACQCDQELVAERPPIAGRGLR